MDRTRRNWRSRIHPRSRILPEPLISKRTAARQKHHERFLLERFFEAAELQAEIAEEREAPDFLVRFENRLIGVEVTELFIADDFSGRALQVQESISTRVVERASELYRKSGGAPAYVRLCFGPDLRDLNRERTATAIASLVHSWNIAPGQHVRWRPEELNGPVPFEVSFIHASGVPKVEMAHWVVARAGWVAPLTEDLLRTRIDEKANQLPIYRAVVPENWLLIVANRTKPSQLFDVGALNARAVTSPFSRSFFYGYPEKPVVELGV